MQNNCKERDELENELDIYIQESHNGTVPQQRAVELNKKLFSSITSLNFTAQIEKSYQYLKKINESLDKIFTQYTSKFINRTEYFQNITLFVKQFNCCNQSAKKLNIVIYHLTRLIEKKNEASKEDNQITSLKVYEKQFAKNYMKIMEIYLFRAITLTFMAQDLSEQHSILLSTANSIINQLDQADRDLHIVEKYTNYLLDIYEQYYCQIYDEWAYQYNSIQFIQRIKIELEKIDKLCIQQNITTKLYKLIDKHILRKHDQLYDAQQQDCLQDLLECYYQSNGKKKSALQDFYYVCKKVNSEFIQFNTILCAHIIKNGELVFQKYNKNKPNQLIHHIQILYYFYKQMNEDCFSKSSDLITQVNKAFESLLSNQAFPKILIEAIDRKVLDQCIKKKQPYDMDQIDQLKKILEFYFFLDNQQQFLKLYQEYLFNRIFTFSRISNAKLNAFIIIEVLTVKMLYNLSGNEEWKSIIHILMKIQQFREQHLSMKNSSIKISSIIQIPQNSFCEYANYVQLPQINQLKIFYQEQLKQEYSLYWEDDFSSVEIYETQQHLTFNVTVRQAVILYEFNIDDGPISLSKLSNSLQGNLSNLKLDLQALTQAKILIQSTINGETVYSYNCSQSQYNKRKKHIFTKFIRLQFCKDEIDDSQKENQKEKILARIAKIMKHSKEMLYQDLLKQVKQSFQIKNEDFKLLVDKLLHLDILSRCQNNKNLLKYQPN